MLAVGTAIAVILTIIYPPGGAKRTRPVPADVAAYMNRVCALPGVKAWIDEALAEQDFIDFEEPFRLSR